MFDNNALPVKQFQLPAHSVVPGTSTQSPVSPNSASPGLSARPYGLCIHPVSGHIAVCDRDSHRVAVFSCDGIYRYDLLTQHDGLRSPCDIAMTSTNDASLGVSCFVAVVESDNGLLNNEPHHSIKLFAL